MLQSASMVLHIPAHTGSRGSTPSCWLVSCFTSLESCSQTAVMPRHGIMSTLHTLLVRVDSAIAQVGMAVRCSVALKADDQHGTSSAVSLQGAFDCQEGDPCINWQGGKLLFVPSQATSSISRLTCGDCSAQAHCIEDRCFPRGTAARLRSTRRCTARCRYRDLSRSKRPYG